MHMCQALRLVVMLASLLPGTAAADRPAVSPRGVAHAARGGESVSAVPAAHPVRATEAGVVEYVGASFADGAVVDVRAADGKVTRYAHLAHVARGVRPGAAIEAGASLGTAGRAESASEPVRFEVRRRGWRVGSGFLPAWSRGDGMTSTAIRQD